MDIANRIKTARFRYFVFWLAQCESEHRPKAEPIKVGMDWSHPSQRRKMYRKKKIYGVEPFNQCRKEQTWRRTVARESKIIGKIWNELNVLAHNQTRWNTGVIDSLCPPWDRE